MIRTQRSLKNEENSLILIKSTSIITWSFGKIGITKIDAGVLRGLRVAFGVMAGLLGLLMASGVASGFLGSQAGLPIDVFLSVNLSKSILLKDKKSCYPSCLMERFGILMDIFCLVFFIPDCFLSSFFSFFNYPLVIL
jgi:hypothetical protein